MWISFALGGALCIAACVWVHKWMEYGRAHGIVEDKRKEK